MRHDKGALATSKRERRSGDLTERRPDWQLGGDSLIHTPTDWRAQHLTDRCNLRPSIAALAAFLVYGELSDV